MWEQFWQSNPEKKIKNMHPSPGELKVFTSLVLSNQHIQKIQNSTVK